jgi:hypothetical protein
MPSRFNDTNIKTISLSHAGCDITHTALLAACNRICPRSLFEPQLPAPSEIDWQGYSSAEGPYPVSTRQGFPGGQGDEDPPPWLSRQLLDQDSAAGRELTWPPAASARTENRGTESATFAEVSMEVVRQIQTRMSNSETPPSSWSRKPPRQRPQPAVFEPPWRTRHGSIPEATRPRKSCPPYSSILRQRSCRGGLALIPIGCCWMRTIALEHDRI